MLPTTRSSIQWAGTLIYREQRQRDSHSSIAKVLDRKYRSYKVPINGRDIIYYYSIPSWQQEWDTMQVSYFWRQSWAHRRTRSGIKSGWSSNACVRAQAWPRAVSWTWTSASTWSRVQTSPRTSACWCKTLPCEPTTRRRRTISKATKGR